jgi:hypothetical protein
VNVSTDLDGRLEFEEDGLRDEDLACLGAEVLDFVFLELDGFAGSVAADCAKGSELWSVFGGFFVVLAVVLRPSR